MVNIFSLEVMLNTLYVMQILMGANGFYYYLVNDQFAINGGLGGTKNYPQPKKENSNMFLHGMLMLLWVVIAFYQLRSKGSGLLHKILGYLGMPVQFSALYFSLSPIKAATIPHLHSILYITVYDVAVYVVAASIALFYFLGLWHILNRRVTQHKTMMMTTMIFSASPAMSRLNHRLAQPLFERAEHVNFDTVWIHELGLCVAMVELMVCVVAAHGGPTAVFRSSKRQPVVAAFWIAVFSLLGLGAVWSTDLFLMRYHDLKPDLFMKEDAPFWISYGL